MFTLIAVVTSFWLIGKHLSFFTSPHVQRHIVRILFLAPLYAVLSWLSYYFYNQGQQLPLGPRCSLALTPPSSSAALYFQLVRDCYEAIVIAAFFFLLVAYLSNPPPTPEQPCPAPYETRAERAARLREVVKDFHLDRWVWPLGGVKWRPAKGGQGEGESFLWLMRLGIGQYVVVRPLSTLVSRFSSLSLRMLIDALRVDRRRQPLLGLLLPRELEPGLHSSLHGNRHHTVGHDSHVLCGTALLRLQEGARALLARP